mmetsp:Transcript_12771/g.39833  ORF Transcript_12771/g.39833 Transcript_12771/m.39833 type:complete len:212 (+) Transcript_12771:1204-1839(+)
MLLLLLLVVLLLIQLLSLLAQGLRLLLLPSLDLPLRAEVAVATLRAILAALRLPEPRAGSALAGAMDQRAHRWQVAALVLQRGRLRAAALAFHRGQLRAAGGSNLRGRRLGKARRRGDGRRVAALAVDVGREDLHGVAPRQAPLRTGRLGSHRGGCVLRLVPPHRLHLQLLPELDLPLGAEVAVAALLAVLAALELPEPRAWPALPRAMQG